MSPKSKESANSFVSNRDLLYDKDGNPIHYKSHKQPSMKHVDSPKKKFKRVMTRKAGQEVGSDIEESFEELINVQEENQKKE